MLLIAFESPIESFRVFVVRVWNLRSRLTVSIRYDSRQWHIAVFQFIFIRFHFSASYLKGSYTCLRVIVAFTNSFYRNHLPLAEANIVFPVRFTQKKKPKLFNGEKHMGVCEPRILQPMNNDGSESHCSAVGHFILDASRLLSSVKLLANENKSIYVRLKYAKMWETNPSQNVIAC